MPGGPGNIEDFNQRLREIRMGEARNRVRAALTRRRVLLFLALLLLVALFVILVPFAGFYTDALWYNHLGFQQLFWKTLVAKILLVLVFGALFFLLFYGNLHLARRIPPKQELDIEGSPLEDFVLSARRVWAKSVGWVLVALSVVASLVAGLGWAGRWETVLRFLNHTSFGRGDQYFGRDIGFYVFSYPFQRMLVDWLLGSLVFIVLAVAVVYVLVGGIRPARGSQMFAPYVKAHLSTLLAAIFLLKAWSYRLNMFELLFSRRGGVVVGVGYTDAHARIPALWIMLALSLIIAAVFLVNIWRRGWLLPAVALGSWVVIALVAGTIYPAIIQNYSVRPSERAKERPYMENFIAGTRDAYAVSAVKPTPFPAGQDLDLAAVQANQPTVRNIRLWDPAPLKNSYQQLQAIRQYYRFNDVDVDRYTVDGAYTQLMVAAREMVQDNLPEAARTWVNNTLVYTHGYGAVMSTSKDITIEGNPELLLSDIPPSGKTNLQNTLPGIYFGELGREYVVTNTTEREFDYPSPAGEVRTTYKGSGGVRVNSIWRKLLFSIRFRDVNLLLSGQVTNESRVMYVKQIRERIDKCAPFLSLDRDPYMVLSDDGKLYWVADCYTTTDRFPYSQPSGGTGNYIRNSVKAVVDAYNGDVTLYVWDSSDPIIRTYQKIFPNIFTPGDEMPPDLRKHVRFPEDMFTAQAEILRTFHMTNPDQFYNKEDAWDFPKEVVDTGSEKIAPYYLIMRLPGQERAEMILLVPYTPHNRQNMIAWLAARMDGDNYGDLINFTFPSGRLIYGPEQIEGRIEQDPAISRQLSLWRQAGSRVIRGNLLVIPIESSLIYVEALYLEATQIQIPQIKQVIVAYGDHLVMEPTLEKALGRIFAGAPATPIAGEVTTPTQPAQPPTQPAQPTQPSGDLPRQALDLYEKAVEAQKAGDWAAYGNYLNQLNQVLRQMAGQ